MTLDLVTLQLKLALQQPGCPICRLRRRSETRYVHFLLYENVNDLETRLHWRASLGMCPAHTWQMYRQEIDGFGDELGNSILYADLCQRLVTELQAYAQRSNGSSPALVARFRHWLARVKDSLDPPSPPLTPEEECRVCEIGLRTVQANLEWLIRSCAGEQPEFCVLYEASAGLCLTHLRQAVAWSLPQHRAGQQFIAAASAQKLALLTCDLNEYIRKHAWDNRHEPVSEGERTSADHAAGFVGGLPPDEGRMKG